MNILDERKNEIKKRNARLYGAKVCSTCGGKLDGLLVCKECKHHERMPAIKRIETIVDDGEFKELLRDCDVDNSASYGYREKFERDKKRTSLNESVVVGECKIRGASFILIVMERYMMVGTLSRASGEKIAQAFEYATDHDLSVVAFASGGGIRIQEGAEGLVQMAKIDATLRRHHKRGLPLITILTDPTYGGTTASFGMMGDINIIESGASAGFGGKMLVTDILHEKVPHDFQSADYIVRHGGVDLVCERKDLRATILKILAVFQGKTKEITIPDSEPTYDHGCKNPETILKNIRAGKRPTGVDYLVKVFDDFVILRGDRISYDDTSLLCGLGELSGIETVFIIQDRGRNLKESTRNNFGMTRPEGFRKAIRMTRLAEKFHLPILILLDSPGAHPGNIAESNCQSIAISESMVSFIEVKTPVITIVTGEGCSGGALALSVADNIAMFSGATYAVISPESYSSIIFNEPKIRPELLEKMKFTASDLYSENLIDEVLDDQDLGYNAIQIKKYFAITLAKIRSLNTDKMLERRYNRIRNWDKHD